MTDSERKWKDDGERHGWVMPSAPFWKRLPIIRRIRAAALSIAVERHNAFWGSIGMVPQGYDAWVLWGIANGKEGKP